MTANQRLAPDFKVTIKDAPIPAELRGSVTSVSYQTSIEGSDRVELTLVNENLRWLDHPLLALDNNLTLSLGYAPDPLERIFVGEIVGHSASFPAGGGPTLTVVAQDRMRRLQQGTKVRWFAIPIASYGNYPLPDTAVASIVSAENGLTPILDPVGAAIATLLGGVEVVAAIGDPDQMQRIIRKQAGESDFDFLERIARENGWEMFVDHTGPQGGYQLHFMSPLDHLAPDVTLKYGQSVLDFSPRISNVGQILSITAHVWVAEIKTSFAITLGWDWDRMRLNLSAQTGFSPTGQGPSDYLIEDPVTPTSAPRQIMSEFIPRLNQRLTGSGSTIGDPRIRAGAVLRLEGLGVQFGGLYRVTSATHTIDSGGYRTSFEVRKEVWFGSVPLPDQGAIPIHVTSPLGG